MIPEDIAQVHAIVDGRVQGVGFRYYVKTVAEELNLTGWVRNKMDGRVEVLAEGGHDALEDLLAALRRGSHSSFVTEIKVDWNPASQVYNRFSIAPSE